MVHVILHNYITTKDLQMHTTELYSYTVFAKNLDGIGNDIYNVTWLCVKIVITCLLFNVN